MRFTIDVHYHILPQFFWRHQCGQQSRGGLTPPP
jgi:hypothetical protein